MMHDTNPAAQTLRVLLVDDVEAVREALRWLLENEEGFNVIGEAGNGVEALERAVRLKPDLVVLDVELPLMDGLRVASTLKSFAPPPFVVFLTVHDDAHTRQRAAHVGSEGFVAKSAGWDALIQVLRRLLPRRDIGGGALGFMRV